jgi:hypothetical protein
MVSGNRTAQPLVDEVLAETSYLQAAAVTAQNSQVPALMVYIFG